MGFQSRRYFFSSLFRSISIEKFTIYSAFVSENKEKGFPLIIQRVSIGYKTEHDLNAADLSNLTSKVFQGSPASIDLQRGDMILRIQQRDVKPMSHHEALELIENSGGSLQLTINR
jgi:hypothetical protein